MSSNVFTGPQRPEAVHSPGPLPPGWTEHRAPTGHLYFYHAASKTSTYTRPIEPPKPNPQMQMQMQMQMPAAVGLVGYNRPNHPVPYNISQFNQYSQQASANFQPRRPRKEEKPDKPKTKRNIPNAEPWLFVTTKKGNAFIHNPDTKESLWTTPDNLKDAIKAMQKLSMEEEREEERRRRRESILERQRQDEEDAQALAEEYNEQHYFEPPDQDDGNDLPARGVKRAVSTVNDDDDGNEEDYYDDEDDIDEEHDEKRLRLAEGGPVEFNEDDIAWQMGAMAEDYGLDEEDLEGNEDLPQEDATVIFKELLDEYEINPYSTWETEMPKLVDDVRYTVMTTTKTRKQVFGDWCQERIAVLKVEREKQVKQDPRIAYLEFLELNATPKLYWPEFRRKFKKEPAMKDTKVTDKDRERFYRDYISRTKTSIETRENDLRKYLKGITDLSTHDSLNNLPVSISCDIRYVAVPRERREQIVAEHLRSLPEESGGKDDTARDILEKQRKALFDREAAVRREQQYNSRDIARSRETLRDKEAEIQRAMNVGKEGLLSHLQPAQDETS